MHQFTWSPSIRAALVHKLAGYLFTQKQDLIISWVNRRSPASEEWTHSGWRGVRLNERSCVWEPSRCGSEPWMNGSRHCTLGSFSASGSHSQCCSEVTWRPSEMIPGSTKSLAVSRIHTKQLVHELVWSNKICTRKKWYNACLIVDTVCSEYIYC